MANTLPKILSKSSIRHDLIESIETCMKTSMLSESHPVSDSNYVWSEVHFILIMNFTYKYYKHHFYHYSLHLWLLCLSAQPCIALHSLA